MEEKSNEVVLNKKIKKQDINLRLGSLKIPDHVKQRASDIKNSMNINMKRGNNLNELIFVCIYSACLELNENINIDELINICDIKHKNISKIIKKFPSVSTGYTIPIENKSPLDYVKEYYYITKLHKSQLNDILLFCNQIIKKSEDINIQSLSDDMPQNVATSLLLYYMDLKGIKYNMDIIPKFVTISSLDNIKKCIGYIDNF